MDQIEEIRTKTDIVQLIGEAVTLKKAGRNFRGLCPFHEEKTPSFMVSPERQMFKCFGCSLGGDVFKFVMEREKIEFGEALRLLADRAGVELKEFRASPDQKIKEKLLAINHLAGEYFHYLLTKHPAGKRARDYLLKRGVTQSSIKTFKLGFAANEWEGLRRYLNKKKNYRDEDLELGGLAIKGDRGFYDRFRDRIMFPLFDHRGRVVGFSGRVLDKGESLPAGRQEAKYVNSPETLIYHKSEILYGLETTKEAVKKANKAVIVEGELDLISSYQAGVKNVVAIKGSALTEAQIDLLKRFCDHLVLALDSDTAGDAASRRGIELAENQGLNVRVIQLQYGKDPDECAQHSPKIWNESVRQAVPVYDFYIASAGKRFGTDTPEGKRQTSDELAPLLARITNQVIKAHYIKKLAEVLEVGEEAVAAEVDKKTVPVRSLTSTLPPPPANREERLEEYLLSLVLARGEGMGQVLADLDLSRITASASARVLQRLKRWWQTNRKWEINRFVHSLPPELVGAVDTAYLTELKGIGDDSESLNREIRRTQGELNRLAARRRIIELNQAIKAAAAVKDKKKLVLFKAELVESTRVLSYNHD